MIDDRTLSLEDWIEEKEMDQLRSDVEVHVGVLSNLDSQEDQESLVRMIMISIRQEIQERLKDV